MGGFTSEDAFNPNRKRASKKAIALPIKICFAGFQVSFKTP